jgi:hypothetical protein
MAIYIGSLPQLTVTFTNLAGVPTNPTSVSLTVTAPDGTQVVYGSPTSVGAGVYTQDIPVLQSGSYNYEWVGTGTVVAVVPGTFQSFPTPLAPTNAIDFVTLPQLKSWIESAGANPSPDDAVLALLITAVSQDMLTRMSRTTIFSADYQEWYDGTGSATQPVDQWPITAVNTLKVNGVVIEPSSDHLQPGYIISRDQRFIQLVGSSGLVPGFGFGGGGISASFSRRCGNVFTQGIGNVYVDYNAGFTSVPADLSEACLLMIDQDYRRRGWVDKAQIAIPQGGGTTTYRMWSIPPRAQEIIERYTRTYHP